MPNDIFIYPTDTVWGIGCSIFSEEGFKKINQIKRTSTNKPLSIMFLEEEQILSSFLLSSKIDLTWLRSFFALESTLGLPAKLCKLKIPPWALAESDYVTIRILKSSIIKEIYGQLNEPFFTTSLNLTGEAPITSLVQAEEFRKNYAPMAKLFSSRDGLKDLSGVSSSIIFLNESLVYEIKREGLKINEIKNLLELIEYK